MNNNNNSVYKSINKVTQPWEEVYTVSKSIVIDSRQRDCKRFKNPSFYTIDLQNEFKNISSVELKGVIFPKSNYNIHSSNNNIDFAIGDFLSGFRILNGGAGYTSAPIIEIAPPPDAGTTATATAYINKGSIVNIAITYAGSGYIPSNPPYILITAPQNKNQSVIPSIKAIIGNHYTAKLRVGEYDIGGNPIPPAVLPSGLLLEIQNAMNYAVNGSSYDPASTNPFAVRLTNQYPVIGAVAGTPDAFDTNACLFNRIQINNVNSSVWQFLWCTGPNHMISCASVFGFNTVDSDVGVYVPDVSTGSGVIIPAGTAIRGTFDYNLKNDPDYVIMSIALNDKNMDRMKSPNDGLNDTFAILFFDNNNPDTLHDLSAAPTGTIETVGGVRYLAGPTGKGIFYRDAGATKPIKGQDYDTKRLSFKPPMGIVSNMTIRFTKFGYGSGGSSISYNMEGREHVLLFEFTASDQKSRQRE